MADFKQLALECGFTVAEELDVSTLKFLPEVRSMCASGRCRRGLLLQTVGDREDSYDFESMAEAERENRRHFDALLEKLRALGADVLPMSAGTCTRCETCTYPDAPCRFPHTLAPSMEACGLFVSKVCKDNGVPYYYGDDKIAYTCCLLY